MGFGSLEVLRYARRIVEDGGDPNPCELGPYCLRCCIAIAKGDLDRFHGTGLSSFEKMADVLIRGITEVDSDLPLIQARDLIGVRDKGIVHTKETALALLDTTIGEL